MVSNSCRLNKAHLEIKSKEMTYISFRSYNLLLVLFAILVSGGKPGGKYREPVDTVGFATRSWQMDSVMSRIFSLQGQKIVDAWNQHDIKRFTPWKTAICPHDDYTYAGWLYPAALRNIKANTVILIGVAHKAKKFGLANRIVFEDFDGWKGPYGIAKTSEWRHKFTNYLPKSTNVVHDSAHASEHSVEALIPVLQYYNRKVQIIPVLIPYMSYETMEELASSFALALSKVIQEQDLKWNSDLAIVISNDAVHYGDESWGGSNYAPYGSDSAGYKRALEHEQEIIQTCLTGPLSREKIRRFTQFTIQDTNYCTYKWTWCGRYSIPFGLLTTYYLERALHTDPVSGILLGYGTSISQPPVPVDDLKMGQTAPATLRHWVGYVAVGFK